MPLLDLRSIHLLTACFQKKKKNYTSFSNLFVFYLFVSFYLLYNYKKPSNTSLLILFLHSKKKVLYSTKVVLWIVIIWEPLLVLYSTKSWCFSGSSAVLHRFFGMTEGLYRVYTICFLFIYYIIKKTTCYCYMYCVRLTETCYSPCISLLFLLILIASIVLICKSLWIKASAKWLNVIVLEWYLKDHVTNQLCHHRNKIHFEIY